MKIRLTGTKAECDLVVDALRALPNLSVTYVSHTYPSYREPAHIRVYVEATTTTGEQPPGGEVRIEYRAWLHGGDPRAIRLETESSPRRADVVEWAEEQIGRYGITGYRVMRREHYIFAEGSRFATTITPWTEDVDDEDQPRDRERTSE